MLATGRGQPSVRRRAPIGGDYYTVRECLPQPGSYWAPRIDPDGVLRDRLTEQERLRYLGDVSDELAFVGELTPGLVCDIGAGPGWFLGAMSADWRKCAIETDPAAIAVLCEYGITVHQTLDYVEESVCDLVIAHHVIEHLRDPLLTLAKIWRVLRPGGWLLMATPDFCSPCAKRFGERYRMLHDSTHCSLFSNESAHRFLSDNGFAIHDVRYPFPARYATPENWARWNDTSKVSPPWPGNWLTFYATKQ